MTIFSFLLLADVEDVIKAISPIIIMVLWGVMQLMSGRPKQNPPPRPREVPPQPAAPLGQAGQPRPPLTLEETLRREVDEFMRRAQRREPEPPKRPQQKPQSKPQPAGGPSREGRPARPGGARQDQPTRRLVEAARPLSEQQESAQPARKPPTGASVGAHVAEHVGRSTEALAAHAKHLGAQVAQADERLEEHLQKKFSHQLGALEHRDERPEVKAKRSVIAQGLFDMLAKPGGVRQVIVAGEILRRPEERWGWGRGATPGGAGSASLARDEVTRQTGGASNRGA